MADTANIYDENMVYSADNARMLLKEQNKINAEEEALRVSIEKALEEKNEQLISVNNQMDLMIKNTIDARGVEAFMNDKNFSNVAYQRAWSNDLPFSSREINVHKIVANCLQTLPYVYGGGAITVISIPRGAEESKLDELAESLGKIFAIQRELLEHSNIEASIGIVRDTKETTGQTSIIVDDTGKYVCFGKDYGDGIFTHEVREAFNTLREALGYVADNWTYDATQEYKDRYPDWDLEDEEDDDNYEVEVIRPY